MSILRRKQPSPIPSVEVLDLRPGDTLIVEVHERLTIAAATEIRRQFLDYFGEATRIVVVQNASLKVLREGDPPPPPVIMAPGSTR